MRKSILLLLLPILLPGCGLSLKPTPSQSLTVTKAICPSYKNVLKGHKAKLADELDQAAQGAVWPDVAVAYVNLTDQLNAEGCPPVNAK